MKSDIRLLTLSKRTLPLKESLCSMLGSDYGNHTSGNAFYSFQDYHLIEVTPVQLDADHGDMWKEAYKVRKHIREQHLYTEMRVLQNTILVGDSSNAKFWEETPNTLYFSMLHLSNRSKSNGDEFIKAIDHIQAKVKELVAQDNWALYYSWDFCDVVLFTKNISLACHNSILWDLMTQPFYEARYFIDTVTIFAFEAAFLHKKWKEFSEKPLCCEQLICKESKTIIQEKCDIELRLNLQSQYPWFHFLETMKQLGVNYTPEQSHFAMGRYDLILQLSNLSFDQILYLIFSLEESLFSDKKTIACGSYELSFLSQKEADQGSITLNDLGSFPQIPSEYALIFKYIEDIISRTEHWIKSKEDILSQVSGITEICLRERNIFKSIKATLEQGFAEEFGLSVLPAFIAFIEFTEAKLRNPKKADPIQRGEAPFHIQDSTYANAFWEFQQKFLTGISTLSHCTMHSDKQFIQVPSFQMRLFEVQPKLLVLYSKLAHDIARYLQCSSGDKTSNGLYEFLVIPDVRPDVYIDPISSADGFNTDDESGNMTEDKIMLVKMREETFYEPIMAAAVLCHEVAHHVGDNCRNRELRTQEYFSILAMFMLLNGLEENLKKETFAPLYSLLADTISGWIIKEVFDQPNRFPGSLHNHRQTLQAFLIQENYFVDTFSDDEFPCEIARESLSRLPEDSNERENIRNILKEIAECLEDAWTPKCCMLSSLFEDDSTAQYAEVQTISCLIERARGNFRRNLLACGATCENDNKCNSLGKDYRITMNIYRLFCKNVLDAFSEAYADLRMIQMLGLDYSNLNDAKASYHSIMESFGVVADKSLESMMRRDAIRRVLTEDTPLKAPEFSIGYPNMFTNFAEHRICSYLKKCQADFQEGLSENPIPNFIKAISNHQPSEMCWNIQNAMASFRKQIADERGREARKGD